MDKCIFKAVTITKPYSKFNRLSKLSDSKVELTFSDRITIVSGVNGTGKSTVIDAIASRVLGDDVNGVEIDTQQVMHFFFKLKDLDAKRMIHDAPDSLKYDGQYISTWLDRSHSSHGQMNSATLKDLANLCESKEPMVVFVDEPELGLDVDNLIKFIKLLKSTTHVQFVVATHHPFLLLDDDFTQLELSPGYCTKVWRQLKQIIIEF